MNLYALEEIFELEKKEGRAGTIAKVGGTGVGALSAAGYYKAARDNAIEARYKSNIKRKKAEWRAKDSAYEKEYHDNAVKRHKERYGSKGVPPTEKGAAQVAKQTEGHPRHKRKKIYGAHGKKLEERYGKRLGVGFHSGRKDQAIRGKWVHTASGKKVFKPSKLSRFLRDGTVRAGPFSGMKLPFSFRGAKLPRVLTGIR
jgi:hypothetical protein